jgi:hypothetical protein
VVENISYLAAQALIAGNSSVIIATDAHLEQIRQKLARFGLNLDALRIAGRYVAAEASTALSQFMVDGCPDKAKFDRFIGGIVHGAAESSASGFVFAFGEMVGLLCAANNPDGAVLLEQFWNSLAERYRFSLYCAYSLSSLGTEPSGDTVIKICAEHALTVHTEISG